MDLGALVRRLAAGPSRVGEAGAPGGSGGSGEAGTTAESADRLFAHPAWRDAPPLQRVVGPAPLVAPNAAFEARLATAQPAPLALAPLGHERGLEAPAGLVSGIAAPVQRSPSAPMPGTVRAAHGARHDASVQRRVSEASEPIWPTEAATDAAFVGDRPLGGGSAPADDDTAAPGGTVMAPPAVSRSSLTTAPSPVTGLVGFIGPAAVAPRAGGASAAPAASLVSPGPAHATSTAPVVARSLAVEDGRTATSRPMLGDGSSRLGPTPSGVGDRPIRRIRVGAPLTPTVSRLAVPNSPSSASQTAPSSTMASGQESPLASGSATSSEPTAAALTPAAPAGRGSVTGSAAGPGGTSAGNSPEPVPASPTIAAAASPTTPSTAVATLQRAALPSAAKSPLVGGLRPILTAASGAISVSRQSAHEGDADGAEGTPATSTGALAALGRTDWAAMGSTSSPSDLDSLGGAGAGHSAPGTGFAVEPGQGGIAPARLTWTNPLADPGAPTAAGQVPGLPTSDRFQPLTVEAATASSASIPSAASSPTVSRWPASTPSAPRPASRSGLRVGPAIASTLDSPAARAATDLPVRPVFAGSPRGAAAGQPWDGAPTVSRAVTISELEVTPEPAPASTPAGATSAAGQSPSAGESPTTGGGSPVGGGSPAGAGGSGATSEAARDQETQAWADRLYDRISLRLRRDLLVERERSGALVDRGF